MKLHLLFSMVIASLALCTNAKSTNSFDEVAKRVADFLELTRNDYQTNEIETRGVEQSWSEKLEEFIKSHDATFKLPFSGTTAVISARNFDSDQQIDLKLRSKSEATVEERGKKNKLKKILVPIFVFLLIKAMVMIPLALGILAIKTWNALQLSFVSFVIALGMSVWQLCKKVAGDHSPPPIIAHGGWETDRVWQQAQNMAYSAHAQH